MSYQLLSYQSPTGPRAGVRVQSQIYDVAVVSGLPSLVSVMDVLAKWEVHHPLLQEVAARIGRGEAVDGRVEGAKLLAPLLYPGDLYCTGGNYNDHGSEMEKLIGPDRIPTLKEVQDAPWFFQKSARTCVGPDAEIEMPTHGSGLDWELELGVVIGRETKDIPVERALGCVAGYVVANDLSLRGLMKRTKLPPSAPFFYDWMAQKTFDGASPIGPWIVPADQIPDPQNLAMKLWVGDELQQNSNTSRMIFSVAELVAGLSRFVTLRPGDLILTGTPAGVGMGRGRFLQRGETVRLRIEGIGEFSHHII